MEKEQSIQKTSTTTLVVMLSTFVSRLLGFIRIAVISAVFGASGNADVINLTFAIPNNLRKLLAEGALSSAFIPVLSESIVSYGTHDNRTKLMVRSIVTFQMIILIPLSILSIVFAKPLIEHVLTQFHDPHQILLSVSLLRFFINYLIFISISAVMIAVLNSSGHFFIPAVTPILFSLSVITSILILYKYIGIYSMAVGVLCGGLFQIIFQYPLFSKLGFDLKPSVNFNDVQFHKILKNWIPVLATSSIFTINQQIAFLFASGLEAGSTSALTNALVFWQLPFGIFSASITTVLFPKMSRQVTVGDRAGLRESISTGLKMLFSLLIPSAFVLALFGKLIIASALQRGLFTVDNSSMTAMVLSGYALGLFSVGGFNFLLRFYYASKNFKTPFVIAAIVCSVDILLSIYLKGTRLSVTGLAVANSIAFTLGFIILYVRIRKKMENLFTKKLIETMIKVFISILPAIIISLFANKYMGNAWRSGGTFYNFLLVCILSLVWILSTLGMYKLTKNEIFTFLKRKKRENGSKNI